MEGMTAQPFAHRGADGMERMSCADGICFKDVQPEREGHGVILPDQPQIGQPLNTPVVNPDTY